MASVFRQEYTIEGKDGKRVRKQSQYWYIDYKTADGTRKRIKGFKDKTATTQLAAKLEKESELAQAGIIDKYKEHRKMPLAKHLEDFKQSLLSKGNTEKHALMTYNRAKTVIEGCRFTFIADVSASDVQNYLAQRRKDGMSKKTSNYYLKSTKQFFSWMKSDSRIGENPLETLVGVNAQTDIRRVRRALNPEELNKMIESAFQGENSHGLSGRERGMLYILAAFTGLRANELASLKWRSFDFDTQAPCLRVEAAYSKHRREDLLPIHAEIAALFKQWKEERNEDADTKVFCAGKYMKWAKMIKNDLEKAGIPYKDDVGRVADFHSLRHTFITNVVKGGASPKVAQGLARHSKITLTMDVYTLESAGPAGGSGWAS